MKRYGWIIGVKDEKIDEYKRLHADVWPGVLEMIRQCHIQNYSIYLRKLEDGRSYLFSYLEYTGTDPKTDFARVGEDPTVKNEWWPLTDACQRRLPGTPEGEQWKPIEMLMLIE